MKDPKAACHFTPRRIFLIAAITVGTTGCNLADSLTPAPTLTPARQLAGTWSTAIPVTFFYQTDFCSNRKETVAQARWNVTWTLTAVAGFENVLDVEMRFTRTSSTAVASSCGSGGNGWVPLVSPTFFRATVSSSAITASDTRTGLSAPGSYTTDLMMLTWNHYECLIYCSGEFTMPNELKLVRQR